jgi:hypothetical protein
VKLELRFKKTTVFILLFGAFLIGSCRVSYPKETIAQDLEELVKKETGKDVKSSVIGRTLYLDMPLEELTSQNQTVARHAMNKIQTASFDIARVVLSSDSEIKYMVAVIYDINKYICFRIIQNIEDIKSYMYMRISRDDYLSRNLLEIETLKEAERAISGREDISDTEFVGRLIVSNINSAARTNPFLGTMVSSFNLRFKGVKQGILLLSSSTLIEDGVKPLLEDFIQKEIQNYSRKYNKPFIGFRIHSPEGKISLQRFFATVMS